LNSIIIHVEYAPGLFAPPVVARVCVGRMPKAGGRGVKATTVASSIGSIGRSANYKRRGLWAIKAKNGGKFPVTAKAAAPAAATANPRFYPAEDAPKPMHKKSSRKVRSARAAQAGRTACRAVAEQRWACGDLPALAPGLLTHRPQAVAPLRASLVPGAVLILLVGRFKGKRVVFLKQLPSGLLLVSGPFAVNGVPARRVNAAFVIATSTVVNVSGVDTAAFTDDFFKSKPAKDRTHSLNDEDFFAAQSGAAKTLPAEYLAAQAKLDAALAGKLSEELKGYLNTRFTLRSGDKPHQMSF